MPLIIKKKIKIYDHLKCPLGNIGPSDLMNKDCINNKTSYSI